MTRGAVRKCSKCDMALPQGRKIYAEIEGGWAIEHDSGGAHNVRHPIFTGYLLCAMCFQRQRGEKVRQILRPLCTDCHQAPVRLRQIIQGWTQLPATKAVHDAHYGALHLCGPCWLKRMEGEQLALFDG